MGRLEHLKQTLPTRIHPDCENIVVDWSCPDNCGNWVEENYPDVKVIRVPNQQFFDHAESRNVGFEHATGEFICQADADLIITPSFFELLPTFRHDSYYIRIPTSLFTTSIQQKMTLRKNEWHEESSNKTITPMWNWRGVDGSMQRDGVPLTGCIIFSKNIIKEYGGFNHKFSNVGSEDIDFRLKLLFSAGLSEKELNSGNVETIHHSNNARVENLRIESHYEMLDNARIEIDRRWGKDWTVRADTLIKKGK